MNQEFLITLFQDSIKFVFLISVPCLIPILLIGILISFLQSITQIHEQTLSFIPKILSIFLSLIFFGPWMLQLTIQYIRNIFYIISTVN
ncbi:flagellar biosynthesis protein FliQ [Buchnera aphidicola]|uniref:Flagellar biosynthetic protein FliQ n=1 Tax=Buchnera aphidicola subsp. Cinara cedri (strain Cc) TaxID=372461 RepID=Q058C1_BUCCC|nr:flagellar biosynthesis protein FliQ [Buchnera aphidicola]ABJ90528.1 type III protein export, membrane component [Buchnera aphidicola BCc]